MIKNDVELKAAKERIARFWQMIETIRDDEENSENYRASVGGFLNEIDRMNLEVREYLSIHSSELEREKIAA